MNKFILPEDLIENIRGLLVYEDAQRWKLGDYLVEICDELVPALNTMGVSSPRHYIFSQIASRVGCDPSTLRDRENMARFFSPQDRSHYPFTYHQFRALKSARNEWRKYADYFAEHLPAPVALIRDTIKREGEIPPLWLRRLDSVAIQCRNIADDEEAPKEIREYMLDILRDISPWLSNQTMANEL